MVKEIISYSAVCDLLDADEFDPKITNRNLVNNKPILKDKVDKNYKFVKKDWFFKIWSFLFYCFAFVVLFPTLWLFYMPKVKGRKNLKKAKNTVFVANHCFIMDCAILSVYVLPFKRPYILSEKVDFQIPVIKTILKSLRAVPIPDDLAAYRNFISSIDGELQAGKNLLVYPEGSLWPYFARIRPFQSSAFRFSVKNNVSVTPVVFSFRKPKGLYKLFGRKKPFVNVEILEPINVENTGDLKGDERRLNEKVNKAMIDAFNKSNTYVYINEKRLKKEQDKLKK